VRGFRLGIALAIPARPVCTGRQALQNEHGCSTFIHGWVVCQAIAVIVETVANFGARISGNTDLATWSWAFNPCIAPLCWDTGPKAARSAFAQRVGRKTAEVCLPESNGVVGHDVAIIVLAVTRLDIFREILRIVVIAVEPRRLVDQVHQHSGTRDLFPFGVGADDDLDIAGAATVENRSHVGANAIRVTVRVIEPTRVGCSGLAAVLRVAVAIGISIVAANSAVRLRPCAHADAHAISFSRLSFSPIIGGFATARVIARGTVTGPELLCARLVREIGNSVAVRVDRGTADLRERMVHVINIEIGDRLTIVAVMLTRSVLVADARAKTIAVCVSTCSTGRVEGHAKLPVARPPKSGPATRVKRRALIPHGATPLRTRNETVPLLSRRRTKRGVEPANRVRLAPTLGATRVTKVGRVSVGYLERGNTEGGHWLPLRLCLTVQALG
jgi:hypothetical protein